MKKEKEFNLSEKRKEVLKWGKSHFEIPEGALEFIFDEIEKDDKEFIRLLKTPKRDGGLNINVTGKTIIVPMEDFKKLAGENLK